MKLPIFVVAVSAFAIAGPATAQGTNVATEEAEEEEHPDDRIRCQTRRVTGSNARRHRICMTVGEWRELARSGNRDARRVVGWGASCPTPDSGC